jgi:hypothetical protein
VSRFPGTAQAVPFAVKAEDAERIYHRWAKQQAPFWSAPSIKSLYSYFVPFWSFEADLTTKVAGQVYRKHASGPAMQVYGGHTFRRKMTEVLKTEVSYAVPFQSSMLNLDNRVDIDEWSLYESVALELIRDQVLQDEAEFHYHSHPGKEVEVSYTNLVSSRVLFPAHIIE